MQCSTEPNSNDKMGDRQVTRTSYKCSMAIILFYLKSLGSDIDDIQP